jgi:hypothetical protein
MKNRNAYMPIVAAMMFCGLGLTACEPERAEGTELEFVCYDDGALVERHVGVIKAMRSHNSTAWQLRYKDGQKAYYVQPLGETCKVTFAINGVWPVTTVEQGWSQDYTDLVSEENLCKFVPGTTYKDREGREYKFIAHVPEATIYQRAIFLNQYNSVVFRSEYGSMSSKASENHLKILPNKTTRTISVHRGQYGSVIALDEGAPVPAGFSKKIGDVVEEIETY